MQAQKTGRPLRDARGTPSVLRLLERLVVRIALEVALGQRIAAQMSEEERVTRADYVIVSDDRTPVLPQILKLHEIFSRL